MRHRGDYGRRLSEAERLGIRERIAVGQTHAQVTEAIGCSTKSIQRLLTLGDSAKGLECDSPATGSTSRSAGAPGCVLRPLHAAFRTPRLLNDGFR